MCNENKPATDAPQQVLEKLENIERLLRTLPETVAAQIQIERERADRLKFRGLSYSDSVIMPTPLDR